ncbi:MAG: hypothetical protein PHV37_00605 [Candidatus Gastranaerophilales bacterium]|nr:hypothetical protein [Candidatus Gastranaerophilales bacterium]
MKQNEIDNIRHGMLVCQMRLKNLQPHIEHSSNLSEIYNKVLIEKAILRKELTKEHKGFIQKFIDKFAKKPTKRICDYF